MLHPNTEVQWMDVPSQKVYTDTVMKMYQMYSHKATKFLEGSETVYSYSSIPDKVKIQDWYGWTDVKVIKRIEGISEWVYLIIANHQLLVTNQTLIPVYDIKNPFQGFHGETKYPFIVKPVQVMTLEDMVRIRMGKDSNGEEIEFTPTYPGLIFQMKQRDCNHGYEIITQSGFFNAQNVHLWGKELPG